MADQDFVEFESRVRVLTTVQTAGRVLVSYDEEGIYSEPPRYLLRWHRVLSEQQYHQLRGIIEKAQWAFHSQNICVQSCIGLLALPTLGATLWCHNSRGAEKNLHNKAVCESVEKAIHAFARAQGLYCSVNVELRTSDDCCYTAYCSTMVAEFAFFLQLAPLSRATQVMPHAPASGHHPASIYAEPLPVAIMAPADARGRGNPTTVLRQPLLEGGH